MDTEDQFQEEVRLVNEASLAFDELCQRRHDVGEEKYGTNGFVEVDTVQRMMEELADVANFARYTYVKLHLTQQATTPSGFVPTRRTE